MERWISRLAVSGFVAAVALAPVGFGRDSAAPQWSSAWAMGGGGGDHGSGDHGGSDRGGSDRGGSDRGGGNSGGRDSGAVGGGPSIESADNDHKNTGKTASGLGALNASNASPKAFAHANPTSRVGRIAAFKAAANTLSQANAALAAAERQLATDITNNASAQTIANDKMAVAGAQMTQANAQTAAAQALANAANKSITTSTVQALDKRLGVTLTTADASALADQAASLQ